MSGCFFKRNIPDPDKKQDKNIVETVEEVEKEIETPFIEDSESNIVETNLAMSNSFYPVKESLDDIRREMNELKELAKMKQELLFQLLIMICLKW